MRLSVAIIALTVSFAKPLLAQAEPDSIRRRNNCRLALQVIETGNPQPRQEWALQYIPFCAPGERAMAYLARIRQLRQSSSVVNLRRAMPLGVFRDAALFEAVADLAQDRTASTTARIVALMELSALVGDRYSFPVFEGFSSGLNERGLPRRSCARTNAHPRGREDGATPLPADYAPRVAAIADRIATDEAEPSEIRSAASCV
jgi:hypothetical protein